MDKIEIKFKCEHCQQEYLQDSFNIAVFLYGIFFLMGKEYGYAGITCPSCLKTITQEGNKDLIESIRKHVSSPIDYTNYQFRLDLRYHSSVNYFPKTIQAYKDIKSTYWNSELPVDDLHNTQMQILTDMESDIIENFFCTYTFDDKPPMGSFLSVGWFDRDSIESLIQIENQDNLRIFPRYVPWNPIYENIEKICWENYLYLNYLEDIRDETEDIIKYLKEYAKQNNVEFEDILAANPNMVRPSPAADMKNKFVAQTNRLRFKICSNNAKIFNLQRLQKYSGYSPVAKIW